MQSINNETENRSIVEIIDDSLEEHDDDQKEEKFFQMSRKNYFFLAALVFFFNFGLIGQFSIMSQYIFHRYAVHRGVPGGGTNTNETMCNINKSDASVALNTLAQKDAAYLTMYGSIAQGIPSSFLVIVYGVYSDHYGRRIPIFCSWIAYNLQSIIIVLMMVLNGPLWLYVIAGFVSACGGLVTNMLCGVFSMIADSTNKESRGLYITLFEAVFGMSLIATFITSGFLIRTFGFTWVYIGMSSVVFAAGFLIFFVPETLVKQNVNNSPQTSMNPIAVISEGFKVFTKEKRRGLLLALILVSFLVYFVSSFGSFTVTTLYLLDPPFCWTSVLLGNYTGLSVLGQSITMTGVILIFRRRINPILCIWLGIATYIGSRIIFGTAYLLPDPVCTYVIFGNILVCGLSGLCTPFFRSILSKTVTASEQGVVFATVASMEQIGTLLSNTTMSFLYSVSLTFMPGFVFILSAFLSLVALCIFTVYAILQRLWGKYDGYKEIPGNNSDVHHD